ncbi:MAG: PQQ-binding-like beta-propeller repeat protein, partial [Chloroflexota bacterium]
MIIGVPILLAGCGGAAPPVGWSNPTGAQDTLYVGSTGGKVYALDPSNGKQKWQFPADNNKLGVIYATPLVRDGRVIVASSDKKLYVLDVGSGGKICEYETGDALIATPAYADGTVYVGSADIAPTLQDLTKNFDLSRIPDMVRPAPRKLYAIDSQKCAKQWDFTAQDKIWAEPLIVGDTIYVASLDHRLYALNRTTHAERWRFEAGGGIASSPKSNDGLIYFGSFDNKVYAVNAADGKKAWEFATGNWVWADPLLVGNLVVIGSLDNKVYALDAKTGQQKWATPTGGGVRAAASGNSAFVYVGSEDHKVYALNVVDGAAVWAQPYDTMSSVLATPTLINGMVIVQNTTHKVIALDAASGQKKWEIETD